MGDMALYFQDLKEINKKKKEDKNNYYMPILKELGAVEKSNAVYEYDGWFLYPTKGFAMNKQNNKKRRNLDQFLREIFEK